MRSSGHNKRGCGLLTTHFCRFLLQLQWSSGQNGKFLNCPPTSRWKWDITWAIEERCLISCETCIHEGKPPKIFKSRSCQKIHFNNWHKIGTYLCDTCGESFNLRGQLRNHNSAKHSQKSQPKGGACPHCGKVVKNVAGHIAIVHQKEECVCPICAKIFNTYKQMRDHMLYNHNNEGKVFICHICSKELGNELNLKQHLRRQHYQVTAPEDFVSCNECGKQFPTEYRLKSHHRAVHESDPSTCDVCGGNYKNNYSLSKHMKNAHSGDISGSTAGKGSYRMTWYAIHCNALTYAPSQSPAQS